MSGEVGIFAWREALDEISKSAPYCINRSHRRARRKAFDLANADSIGIRFGLQGGMNTRLVPRASVASRMPVVATQVVHDHQASRLDGRDRNIDIGQERRAVEYAGSRRGLFHCSDAVG